MVEVARADVSARQLRRTKWFALAGCILTVSSSTILYANFGWFLTALTIERYWVAHTWFLNPLVFGSNLDVALNCLGMLMACGVLNFCICDVSCRWVTRREGALRKQKNPSPAGDIGDIL